MKDKCLFWFVRFLYVPSLLTLSYYPLFVHKLPDAIFSLRALLAMADD